MSLSQLLRKEGWVLKSLGWAWRWGGGEKENHGAPTPRLRQPCEAPPYPPNPRHLQCPMNAVFCSSPSCPLPHMDPDPGGGVGEMTANVGYLEGPWLELLCVARARAVVLGVSPARLDLGHDRMDLADRHQSALST